MKINAKKNSKKNNYLLHMIILCLVGIVINYVLSTLVMLLGLPIYVDCVGTIVVAAIGGALPAVIVAFVSNLFTSVEVALNLYYWIPGVLLAVCAAVLSKNGMFQKLRGILLSAFYFSLIAGLLRAIMGWFIFGQQINGTAAPFAFYIYGHGVTPFVAQTIAELGVDFVDKLITLIIACFVLHIYPKKAYEYEKEEQKYQHSVKNRLTKIVVISVAAVGVFSIIIGIFYYQQILFQNSEANSKYISVRAAQCIDGDLVGKQFKEGKTSGGYKETEKKLKEVCKDGTDIRNLCVYVIKKNVNYVLYDVDILGEERQGVGTKLIKESDVLNLTARTPIYDSTGDTVAYARADIDLNVYFQKLWIYAIQSASLVFAIMLLTLLFMIWYVTKYITKPIQTIVAQTNNLKNVSPEDWLDSDEWHRKVPIKTGDEIEELYMTVTNAEENASINVKKRIETERNIQKADAANQAKTDFLSRMSHDMRTPMNAIIGLSSLTIDDADNPDVVRENMAKIRSSSDFLLGLVNDILDLAKIEDGSVVLHPEPYSYQEFLTNMKTMFQSQCRAKNIELIFEELKENPVIRVDKMRINQIFFNVFSNAVKYTPMGGVVQYRMENYCQEAKELSADFVVQDNGIGMSKEYQEHLFEAFVQENEEVTSNLQGSGLGLSITKQLVDLMGGIIHIDSEKGKGTTVKISLTFECIEEDGKIIRRGNKGAESDKNLIGKRVLLVEDHPVNAQIARKLLEKKQMIVSYGENGKVAVDIFKSSEINSFDVILMDIRMPEMSGLMATTTIRGLDREDAKTIPIIAMSANAYPEDIEKSLEAGMNEHLPKPVDPEELYKTLRSTFA